MAIDRINDAQAFRDFLDAKLSNGGQSIKLDDALELWQYENQSEGERQETHRAIQQGLDDIESGRVRPFEDFDREFRQKHRIPPRA